MASSGFIYPITVVSDASTGTVAWSAPLSACVDDGNLTSALIGVSPTEVGVRLVINGSMVGSFVTRSLSGASGTAVATYGHPTYLWNQSSIAVSSVNASGFGVEYLVRGMGGLSQGLKATNFDASIPSGATIDGIEFQIDRGWHGTGPGYGDVDYIALKVYYSHNPITVLQTSIKPNFASGHTLLPLSRYGWNLPFDATTQEQVDYNVEAAEEYGYAMEIVMPLTTTVFDNPDSYESKILAKAATDPDRYPVYLILYREFTAPIPESMYCHLDGVSGTAATRILEGTTHGLTLASTLSATGMTVTAQSAVSSSLPTSGYLRIELETLKYSSYAGSAFTISERGVFGTAATGHAAATVIKDKTRNFYSPETPDSVFNNYADTWTPAIAYMLAMYPTVKFSIALNGGERGLSVIGNETAAYVQDSSVVDALGTNTPTTDNFFDYISAKKANQETLIKTKFKAALPAISTYIFYTTDGAGTKISTGNTWKLWCWDYPDMRTASDLPSQQNYYLWDGHYTGDWTENITTGLLNMYGQQIAAGDPLQYNWVAGGWIVETKTAWTSGSDAATGVLRIYEGRSYRCIQESGSCSATNYPVPEGNAWWTYEVDEPGSGVYTRVSPYNRWMGFTKQMYTCGMLGCNVGYYWLPYKFDTVWNEQIKLHAHAHALFSHLEHYLREGSLLPGPDMHESATDQPAYEFPNDTSDADAHVTVRKLDSYNEWLISAFAASGDARDITVTIPILGETTVQARPEGAIYTAYKVNGLPLTTLIDTDGMYPSTGLAARGSITLDTPTFLPTPGTLIGPQTVTIASTTGSTIYYTNDGTTPTTGSNLYNSAGISIGTSQVIKAFAVRYGDTQSAVASADYTIVATDLLQTGLKASWDLATTTKNLMPSGHADCDAGWDVVSNATRSYTTTGDAAGRVTLVSTANSGYVESQQRYIVGNQTTYSAQVMAYGTSGTERVLLYISLLDNGGNAAGNTNVQNYVTVATSGTLLTAENFKCIYTEKSPKRAYIRVGIANSGQSVSFDKFQLEESTTATEWTTGSGEIQVFPAKNGTTPTLTRGLTTAVESSDISLSKTGGVFVAIASGYADRCLPSTSANWWNGQSNGSTGQSFAIVIKPTQPCNWSNPGIIPDGTVVAFEGHNYVCIRQHAYSTTFSPTGAASSGTWILKPKSTIFDFTNSGAVTGDGSNSGLTSWINEDGTVTVGAKSASGDTLQTHTSTSVIAPSETWTLIGASVDYAAGTITILKNGELFSSLDMGSGKTFGSTTYTSGTATAKDLIGAASNGTSQVDSTILYTAFYTGALPLDSHAQIYDYMKYYANNDHDVVLLGNEADVTAPTLTITYPTTGSTYSTAASSISLSGTSSDNRYVDHIACNNGALSGLVAGTTSWSATASLVAGTNNIVVSAYDLAGNEGTDTLEVTYTPPDTTAPAITITCPTVEATYSTAVSSVTLSGTASDAVGVDRVIWNLGISSGVCAGTTSWSVTSELVTGLNTFVIQAYDAAGNVGSDTIDITYEPPAPDAVSLIIGYPTSGLTYSTQLATITLSGTASGTSAISSVTYSYDTPSTDPELGNCSGNETWTLTHSLLEGLNTFIIYATSEAGGTGSGSIAVTYSLSDYTTRAQQKLIIKPFIINTSGINISSNPTTLLLANIYVGNSSTADTLELIDTRQRGGGLDPKLRLTTAQQEEAKTLWDISTWDGQPTITNGTVVIKIPSSSLIQNGGNFTYEQIEALVNKNAPVGILPLIEYV